MIRERTFTFSYESGDNRKDKISTEKADIEKCIKAGVLPECFEGTGISVEVQRKDKESCFIRNEHGEVTCPTGNILRYAKTKGRCRIYFDRELCRSCKCRCTAASYKEVSFGPDTNCVPVKMFGTSEARFQEIPYNAKISSYNHTLDTKKVPDVKVVLRIKDNKEKLRQRMCLSEHPFGPVKWYHGAHVLCREKKNKLQRWDLVFLPTTSQEQSNVGCHTDRPESCTVLGELSYNHVEYAHRWQSPHRHIIQADRQVFPCFQDAVFPASHRETNY